MSMDDRDSSTSSSSASTSSSSSDSSSSSSSSSSSENELFEVRAYKAVAVWSWDISIENCAICRNHIMSKCLDCQANPAAAAAQSGCTVAWGACGHAFHFHCISRWLKTQNVCPLDTKEWVFTKYGK